MGDTSNWIESKAKEDIGLQFVKTVLKLSGYNVMDFGIENHNQEILKQIKTNYKCDTNKKLLSMPDLVVIDDKTCDSWIVEVKYRNLKKNFDINKSALKFRYGSIKSYLDNWKDSTLILVFNVYPYCICVDFNKINWNRHFQEKILNKEGKQYEVWAFFGIYQYLSQKFPKVSPENFNKAVNLSRLKS